MTRALLQQVLVVLEHYESHDIAGGINNCITAIREYLAQPEQEPVIIHRELVMVHSDGPETWSETPLYTKEQL
jgi:hypothetical protein